MTLRTLSTLLLMLLCISPLSAADPPERLIPTQQRQQLNLTIYPDNLALVRDTRQVELHEGLNRIAFQDVSALLQPETALLRAAGDSGRDIVVLERDYEFDLLTPERLLEEYVGRTVRVIRTHPETGEESEGEATILSAASGVVLRIGERIETQVPGRIVFPELPQDLRHRPTMAVELTSETAGRRELELLYLTGGISWNAAYTARLSPGGETLSLAGFASLTNRSGTDYPDAHLQFVAGEVHRAPEEFFRAEAAVRSSLAADAPAMDRQQAFEYQLYTLERPTTLKSGQTKQVALLSASEIPVRKNYVLRGNEYLFQGRPEEPDRRESVEVSLILENTLEEGLGQPLPAGVVRVYQENAGAPLFIGEDRIGNTPEGEEVRLTLGTAFDLGAERTRTAFERLPSPDRTLQVFEIAWKIVLKNAKEEPVTVRVVEPIPGDWEILQESLPHAVEGRRQAVWEVPVPAGGETALEYIVRIRI